MAKELQSPGAFLALLLEKYKLNPFKLSKEIKLNQSAVRLIIIRKTKITTPVAIRLAKYFNTNPEFWLAMQMKWDIAEAAKDKKLAKVLKGISRVTKASADGEKTGAQKPAKRKKAKRATTRKKTAKKAPKKTRLARKPAARKTTKRSTARKRGAARKPAGRKKAVRKTTAKRKPAGRKKAVRTTTAKRKPAARKKRVTRKPVKARKKTAKRGRPAKK